MGETFKGLKERLLVLLSPRPRFRSNEEVFAAADGLVRALEDAGFAASAAAARRAYASLNGLTDGWYDFLTGLRGVEEGLPPGAAPGIRRALRELIAAARWAVYR